MLINDRLMADRFDGKDSCGIDTVMRPLVTDKLVDEEQN